MLYIRDDDQHRAPFGEPPVVCNYFYHEEITKSAKKKQGDKGINMKIAVRYNTKTGNTKRLAKAVAEAVGDEADMKAAAEFARKIVG